VATSLFERALRLERSGHRAMAMPFFIGATKESPDDPDVWVAAAKAALKLERPDAAAELLEQAVRRHPDCRRAWSKLMIARLRMGETETARHLCHRVLELDPENVQAMTMLGYTAPMVGEGERARSWFDRAFDAERRAGRRRLDSFEARLICGDYRGGWEVFHPDSSYRKPERWVKPIEPYWRGEPDPAATVCLHSFGGIGDLFLLARFFPEIAGRVGTLLIACPEVAAPVIRSVPGVSALVRRPDEAPDGAMYLSGLQIPAVMETTLESVPCSFPYLRPDDASATTGSPRPRVGLAWAGNPALWTDPDRSVPDVELLRPLVAASGIEWVSLQVGPRAEWAAELGIPHRPALRDFGDTARELQRLDLVITVDTAVANLALAMGRPTWVLPPTFVDYRWGPGSGPSPWYPAARLFRRRSTDDWPRVIGDIVATLGERFPAQRPASQEAGLNV
jgi:hypothetical protein